MKKMMLVLGLIFVGMTVSAKEIIVTVPDGLFGAGTTINGNFDGSITVDSPMVIYNGKFTFLNNDSYTGSAICYLLNKEYVHHLSAVVGTVEVVELTKDGHIAAVGRATNIIKAIICK